MRKFLLFNLFPLSGVLTFLLFNFFTSSVLAHSSVQVIKMVPGGFEPTDVAVDENSTLIFTNQDELPRWPASNLHPTHDLYPEFDPKRGIAPGESWTFKPKTPGVWKYHDHLNPHIRGTITVISEAGSDLGNNPNKTADNPDIFETIKKHLAALVNKLKSLFSPSVGEAEINPEEFKKKDAESQFKALSNFAKSRGAEFSWNFIIETYKDSAGSTGNIHDLAHLAGKLVYEEKGIDGIGICTTSFAFGCYHGLLDTAFANSLADLPQAEGGCEKLGPVGSGPYGSCIHGIGHGVASFHQTKDLEAALGSCNGLSAGQDFCYDGVLMEFVRSAATSFYSKDTPLYPCDSLESKYGETYSLACGRNQPSVLMSRFKLGFEQVVQICESAKLSGQFKNSCFEALGFSLASTEDPNQIIKACQTIRNPQFSGLCLKSAAGELIFQDTPGWQEKAPLVCTAASGTYRTLCEEHLQRLIKDYGKEREAQFRLLNKGENPEEYVREQMQICYSTGNSDECYQYAASLFSRQFNLKETLGFFAKGETHPEIYSRCHEATHYLSRNEYKKLGSVPEVYAQCDSTCHGGCYHGVLEQYLKEKEDALANISQEFIKICGKAEDYDKPLVYNECHHGLGHAAMFVTEMGVPESLALCDALTTQENRERCYSGVFMENSSSSTNNDHPGYWVKKDDPMFPCNSLPEKYARLCWQYQSSHFALITNHNWQETASLCLKVPENYQDGCFRTIGTNQVGFTQDVNLMRKNCSLMPTKHFQEVCVTGVVSSFAYRFVGDIGRMEAFCSGVEKDFAQACFTQVGTATIDWVAEKGDAVGYCNNISNQQFSSWCKSAIN